MLKVYDSVMNPLYLEDKKVVHRDALWHKVFTGIFFNKKTRSIYFQTIYPKDSYLFDRPDYIDFTVGGHVDDDEDILDAGIREISEELGFAVNKNQLLFCGIRICNCDPGVEYKIREFQFFYAIEITQDLKLLDFSASEPEVKSILEINIDDFISLLTKKSKSIDASEMLIDKDTRKQIYIENTSIDISRIIPDYLTDTSILEKFLSIKYLMNI